MTRRDNCDCDDTHRQRTIREGPVGLIYHGPGSHPETDDSDEKFRAGELLFYALYEYATYLNVDLESQLSNRSRL
jgi:hypothetical protein